MRTSNQQRATALGMIAMVAMIVLGGCADPEYDTSTPDKALVAMQDMVKDGRADLLKRVLHVEARDITYADGVTEESAISDVIGKTGDLLGQLYRVSKKLNARYPNQVIEEAESAREGGIGAISMILGGAYEGVVSEFLRSPLRFLAEEKEHVSVLDMGDGTAAVLWKGEPAFGGVGLQMVETDEGWKIDIPVNMPPISSVRPETREEWAVLASMMLGFENALIDFEDKLDGGKFSSLADASGHAGRMLGESAVVQAAIYAMMKQKGPDQDGAGSDDQGRDREGAGGT